MGYLKKRRADGELEALEVTDVVGIRTRAGKEEVVGVSSTRRRKKAVVESAEFAVGYLQLRSRRVCMSSRIERSLESAGGRISRCSVNGSCELDEEFDAATCYTPRRETSDEARDLELSVESDPTKRRPAVLMTMTTMMEAEIEEFFAAAERSERKRFASKYNFDVADDVPLPAGRYDWVPLLVMR